MNQVAEACGLSKPSLYHYYRDKYSLLLSIADSHVSRLQALVQEVCGREAGAGGADARADRPHPSRNTPMRRTPIAC